MAYSQDNFIHIENCPVCQSSALSVYKNSTFKIHNLTDKDIRITDSSYGKIWDLCRCNRCTHIFANPSPAPQFIQSLYSQIEDPLYEEETQGRERNFKAILDCLERIHPEKGSLFDVGSATGILLNLAREREWKPDGCEASKWAIKVARDKYNLSLRQGYFETIKLPSNHYSAVSMIDFIEHIPFPRKAMEKASQILAAGGVLCLVTPDSQSLAAKIAGRKWWHLRPAHLGYFTKKSLLTLCGLTGFQIIKTKKYSWTFSALYLLSRLQGLRFLTKNPSLASFWKKIPIKLALGDSFEIYMRKTYP